MEFNKPTEIPSVSTSTDLSTEKVKLISVERSTIKPINGTLKVDTKPLDDGSVTYLDTYQMGTNTSSGYYKVHLIGGFAYQSFELDPVNADGGQTGIAVGVSILNLKTNTAPSCSAFVSNTTPNDTAFFPFVLPDVIAIRGNDETGEKVVLIKIPSSVLVNNTLKVTGIPFQQQYCFISDANNLASYEISCSTFDASLLP